MNHACALRRRHSFFERPRFRFLFARREIRSKPEQIVALANELRNATVGNAETFQKFLALFRRQIAKLRLDLRTNHADARVVVFRHVIAHRRNVAIFFRIGETALVHVARVKHRLRREQEKTFHARTIVVVCRRERRGGLALVQVRNKAVQKLDVRRGFLVLPFDFFQISIELRFARLQVGKHELRRDDFDVAHGIDASHVVNDIVVVKTANNVHDGVHFANIGQKFVAEPLALGRSRDKSRDVHELDDRGNDNVRLRDFRERRQTFVRHFDDADVRLNRAKRIIRRLGVTGTRQRVEERAFADIRQTDDTCLKHNKNFRKS